MYLWILAAVAAYFIKGLCGFANTLVFTSILSFGVANANISPIDLLLGYPTNLILTWKNRKRLVPKVYLPLAALVLAGSIPGAFLLKHVDARAVKVLFGVVVAALGAEMFSREYSKKRLRSSKIVLAIIGVTAGVLCGLFGVGALLAAYVSRVTEDGGSFKANISAVFIVDNTFRIVLYSALGLLTFDTLKTALLLLPFALAGLFLGMKCSSRMNESLVKKITSVLLVLNGISLILKNLGEVIDRIGHVDRAVDPDLFSAVIHHIIGQQISMKAQATIWQRMQDALGAVSAETILAAGVPELQSLGMTFRKAEYITDFAEKVHTGAFDLDAVAHMRDADAIRALSSLKGIGVWTAEMILLFCLQRPDILSYDDLAIQRGLRMVYHHRAIDRRLFEKYRRRYSPYGSVASLYLWAVSGGAIPELKDYKPKSKREAH